SQRCGSFGQSFVVGRTSSGIDTVAPRVRHREARRGPGWLNGREAPSALDDHRQSFGKAKDPCAKFGGTGDCCDSSLNALLFGGSIVVLSANRPSAPANAPLTQSQNPKSETRNPKQPEGPKSESQNQAASRRFEP